MSARRNEKWASELEQLLLYIHTHTHRRTPDCICNCLQRYLCICLSFVRASPRVNWNAAVRFVKSQMINVPSGNRSKRGTKEWVQGERQQTCSFAWLALWWLRSASASASALSAIKHCDSKDTRNIWQRLIRKTMAAGNMQCLSFPSPPFAHCCSLWVSATDKQAACSNPTISPTPTTTTTSTWSNLLFCGKSHWIHLCTASI